MNNKFKIIETADYILAVSDERNTGDVVFNKASGFIYRLEENPVNYEFKIIAHQPKGNSPELDLPLLPEITVEDDIEKLARNYANKKWENYCNRKNPTPAQQEQDLFKKILGIEGSVYDFKQGYKAATKVYSEEDLRKAIEFVVGNYTINSFGNFPNDKSSDNVNNSESLSVIQNKIIQSLKQPKTPKWFVVEIEHYDFDEGWCENTGAYETYKERLKTTTTNGKTYLVGTYEY